MFYIGRVLSIGMGALSWFVVLKDNRFVKLKRENICFDSREIIRECDRRGIDYRDIIALFSDKEVFKATKRADAVKARAPKVFRDLAREIAR